MSFPALAVGQEAGLRRLDVRDLAGVPAPLKHYAVLVARSQMRFLGHLALEVGPFALILAAYGAWKVFRRSPRAAAALLLPTVCYYGVVFLWPIFQLRYIVPVLPAVYVLSALGFAALPTGRPGQRVVAAVVLAGLVPWQAWSYLRWPHTRYYLYAGSYAEEYDQMVPIARQLAELPRGTTLACAEDPIEPMYWHSQPSVAANLAPDRWGAAASRFAVRYVWTDAWGRDRVRSTFPGARRVIGNDRFEVYDLAIDPEHPGGAAAGGSGTDAHAPSR